MADVAVNDKMENTRTWFQAIFDSKPFEMATNFAKERPVAATLIGIAVATSFIPALAFVSFVVVMLIIGIVSLIAIEGTALLIGGTVLLFALCGSMLATIIIGVSILTCLVAGRFLWRVTVPLRAKMVVCFGMCTAENGLSAIKEKGLGAIKQKGISSIKEKGQLEMGSILGFASKATIVETD